MLTKNKYSETPLNWTHSGPDIILSLEGIQILRGYLYRNK